MNTSNLALGKDLVSSQIIEAGITCYNNVSGMCAELKMQL